MTAVLTARVGTKVHTRVTAILADGQRVSRELDDVPGFAGRPMSRTEVERTRTCTLLVERASVGSLEMSKQGDKARSARR